MTDLTAVRSHPQGGADAIDQVAAAINFALAAVEHDCLVSELTTGEIKELARAAIEAMREPTEAMLRSAVRTEDRLDEGQVEVNYMVVAFDIWPKMIDAALKVKP